MRNGEKEHSSLPPSKMFYLAWVFVCNQLEELKQKQKLNRQKEHEKKRKLEAKKNAATIKDKAEGQVGVLSYMILIP